MNSRLHQALVEKGLATNVSSVNYTLRDPFPLLIEATNAPGKAHEEVEAAIKAALAEVAAKGVTDEEVKRAQQQIEVAVVRSRDGTYNFASTLGEAVASTNWKWFLNYVEDVKTVTAADVKRVAATYLVPEHATVGWFIPTPNAKRPDVIPSVARDPAGRGVTARESRPAQPGSLAPARDDTSFAKRTTRRVLRNGITLDIVENHSLPTVAIRGLAFAGDTSTPPGRTIIAALTAKMLGRGTKKRTKEEIGVLLDGVGATRAYSAALNEALINANGMARDLPLLLEVLADELKNPAFAADELAQVKTELENDLLRTDDNTSARAMERLNQLVYAKSHPYYAFGKTDKLAALGAVTEDDLRAFHRSRYIGAGLILAIVGDVDTAKTIALVEKALGDLPKGERLSLTKLDRTQAGEKGVREAVTMRGKANMNIVMGTASGLRRNDSDYEAAIIGNAALGQNSLTSRIGRRVRDTEGLSYNLNSRFGFSDQLDGLWFVNVNVAPQNVAKAMKSTREEIDKFAKEGVTDAEVESQKSFFAGNYQVGLGSNSGIANALVTAEKFGYGPKYLDEFPARIRAVNREQVNAAMRKHFFAERLHVIVAGDLETVPD